MTKLRIVQVTPFFGDKQYGGTERFVVNLSKELARRGHHIDVFTTKDSRDIPYQEYYLNMTVHKFYSPWNVFGINPACIMLHKLLKIQEIDLFHVHSYIYFTSIQATIAKVLRKIPMLLHIHGGVGRPPYETGFTKDFAKLFFDYSLGRFVLSQADSIASVSSQDAEILKKNIWVKSSKISIINNAVDVTNFPIITPVSNERKIVSFIGDMEPWKGIIYYAKVVKEILKSRKNIEFWFVGEGTYKEPIRKFFEKYKNVKVFGAVEHKRIPEILKETNVLVQPSYWEGSPTTIIEAMAMGIPIVGAATGDIPRLLNYGKDGTLFVPGSSVQLKEAIIDTIDNYEQEVIKAKKALERIRREFSFQEIAKHIESLYLKLVN